MRIPRLTVRRVTRPIILFFIDSWQHIAWRWCVSRFPRFRCGTSLFTIERTQGAGTLAQTWPKRQLDLHSYVASAARTQSVGRDKDTAHTSWLHEFAGATWWCAFHHLQETSLFPCEQPVLPIRCIQRAQPSEVSVIESNRIQIQANEINFVVLQFVDAKVWCCWRHIHRWTARSF